MKIEAMILHPYQTTLVTGLERCGVRVELLDDKKNRGWGEIAPLLNWSQETLDEAISQLKDLEKHIFKVEWQIDTFYQELEKLVLFPSVNFGIESALLSLLSPLSAYSMPTSALLMGSPAQIMDQAKQRLAEGFTSAKLKVHSLSFMEAFQVINKLKNNFFLRVDVNRAWDTEDALQFFSQFPKETFDYVEEPFKNPEDLGLFQHPLAVDESFPHSLSLNQLEGLPTLKALIYKPTIQGGMLHCLPLHKWVKARGISLVLSSSFESSIGLTSIASMAHRMSLQTPIGIGTYHYFKECERQLQFSQSSLYVGCTH